VDFVRGVVGWLPLADPDATVQALDRLRPRGKLVGVRHLISNEPDPRWLLQDTVLDSLSLLAAAGLVFDAIERTRFAGVPWGNATLKLHSKDSWWTG
jgi:L-fuconolactonase